jgi:hypothetical protein
MEIRPHLRIPSPAANTFPGLTAHARLRLAQGESLRVPLRMLPYEGPALAGPPAPGLPAPSDLVAHLARPEDRAPWLLDPACSLQEAERWVRAEAFRRCPPEILLATLLGLRPDALAHGPRRLRIALGAERLAPLGIPGEAWGEGWLRAGSRGFPIEDGLHEGRPDAPADLTAGYGEEHDVRLDRIAEHLVMEEIDLATALQRAPRATHAVLRLARVLDQALAIFAQQGAFGP